MPTYTVQSPDGKTITLEGPAGASQDEIFAQARALYQPQTQAPAKTRPKFSASAKGSALTNVAAERALRIGREKLERNIAGKSARQQQLARDRFEADERIINLRQKAGGPVVRSKDQEIRALARQRAERNKAKVGGSGFANALKAGVTRGTSTLTFGLPERAAAAIVSGDPSQFLGGDVLDQVYANTDAELEQNLGGNIIGQILSGGILGRGIGAGVMGTRAGPAIQRAMQTSPKLTTAAVLTGGGAAGGAAGAVGSRPKLPSAGELAAETAIGAVAGPAFWGTAKGLEYIFRPLKEVLPFLSPSEGKIIRRLTKASSEDMAREADRVRATGVEPTLYEVLPLADRNRIAKEVIGRSPESSEQAAELVRQRVANIGPEMAGVLDDATAPRRGHIIRQMVQDLEAARGGVPDISDPDLAVAAVRSPSDMRQFRRAEDSTIMEPIRDNPAAPTVESLYPRTLVAPDPDNPGAVHEVYTSPEINKAISDAAASLRLRPSPGTPGADPAGLTADDIATVIRGLNKKANSGTDGAGAAAEARTHILSIIGQREAGTIEEMIAAHAARSRMLEGVQEGMQTRTRESISLPNQKTENAYLTPEGAEGRFIGQANELQQDLRGTTDDVLRTTGRIAESGQTQMALQGNLGPRAGARVADAAAVEARSVRNLAALGKETGKDADHLDLEDLGRVLLSLSPSAMPTTRLFTLSRLTGVLRLPEAKARAITDMLLSQDPATTNRAINILNGAGTRGQKFLSDFRKALVTGELAGQVLQDEGTPVQRGIPEHEIPVDNAPADIPGLVEPGNIDLHNRPVVENEDGSISTVRSITVGFDDGVYVLPTIVDAQIVSNDEAIAHFRQTGEHLGKFADEASAEAYSQQLHEEQAAEYTSPDNEDTSWADNLAYGRAVIQGIFPEAHVTEDIRPADSDLGKKNPNSYHVRTDGAVDVRPIPGITFEQFVQTIKDNGYEVVEAIDEVKNPSRHATGPHWHVVLA